MNIAILDPGFEHAQAHHLTVNLALGRALADQGVATTVYAAKNVDAEVRKSLELSGIRVVPHFETPCYP
mgnify:FL=1